MILMRGKGKGPAAGRSYLAGRDFGSKVARRWGLGYAPGSAQLVRHLTSKGYTMGELESADLAVVRSGRANDRFFDRVLFPIHDEMGRTIGFGGRVLTDAKPKYLNTKETRVFHKGKNLFAFDRAKEHIAATGTAIVCEGYTDVIAMHEAGITNVVATLGTALTIDHIKTISRFATRITCLFDGDAAGQRAAERSIQFLDKTAADLRYVVLPDNLDPAEYLQAHTADELRAVLDDAHQLMDFVLERRVGVVEANTTGMARVEKAREVGRLLAPLKGSVVLDFYINTAAEKVGLDKETVRRAVEAAPKPRDEQPQPTRSNERREWQQGTTRRQQSQDRRGTTSQGGGKGGYGSSHGGGPEGGFAGGYGGGYDEDVDGYFAPDDYVPAEAMDGVPVQQVTAAGATASPFDSRQLLSADERAQLGAERELLSLMARDVDLFRPHAERIASLVWLDERHEAVAWAMLATPVGTSPAEVVQAAVAVEPSATEVLASGRLAVSEDMGDAAKVAYVLDTCELYSTRRRIDELRARMRRGDDVSTESFAEATALQRHATELFQRLGQGRGGSMP